MLNNPLSYNDPGGELIPVLVWGAVAAWRAYSAYDTVTSAIDNYNTVVDPNASAFEKSMAVLDTGSSVVLPKAVRDIAKKTVGPSMDAAVSKIGDLAEKATDRIKVSAGPLPSKNQVDSNSLSRMGDAKKVDASGKSDVTLKKESGPVQGDSSASGEIVGESSVAKRGVQANKAAGDAFEQQVMGQLQQTQSGVVQQVTVKTQSGVKTRIDLMGRDANGNIVCTECKASATAPLTKSQAAAFPEIQQSGAVVVGKGKPGFLGGTQIPPTTVNIERP